jgi:hypothetical protein
MNSTYFNIIFRFFQSSLFPSAYKYIRYCVSYALNFLRSPEKVSDFIIREYMSFVKTVVIAVAAVIMLSVRLKARFLLFDMDMIAHSVTYYSIMKTLKVLRYLPIRWSQSRVRR